MRVSNMHGTTSKPQKIKGTPLPRPGQILVVQLREYIYPTQEHAAAAMDLTTKTYRKAETGERLEPRSVRKLLAGLFECVTWSELLLPPHPTLDECVQRLRKKPEYQAYLAEHPEMRRNPEPDIVDTARQVADLLTSTDIKEEVTLSAGRARRAFEGSSYVLAYVHWKEGAEALSRCSAGTRTRSEYNIAELLCLLEMLSMLRPIDRAHEEIETTKRINGLLEKMSSVPELIAERYLSELAFICWEHSQRSWARQLSTFASGLVGKGCNEFARHKVVTDHMVISRNLNFTKNLSRAVAVEQAIELAERCKCVGDLQGIANARHSQALCCYGSFTAEEMLALLKKHAAELEHGSPIVRGKTLNMKGHLLVEKGLEEEGKQAVDLAQEIFAAAAIRVMKDPTPEEKASFNSLSKNRLAVRVYSGLPFSENHLKQCVRVAKRSMERS